MTRALFRIWFLAAALALAGCGTPTAQDFPPIGPSGVMDLAAKAKGRVVVINFWATWCGPCRMEFSELMQLREQFPLDQLELAGVSVDDSVDELRVFFGQKKVNYPIYHAEPGTSASFGIQGVPGFLFFTPDGELAYRHSGYLTAAQLTQAVRKLQEKTP